MIKKLTFLFSSAALVLAGSFVGGPAMAQETLADAPAGTHVDTRSAEDEGSVPTEAQGPETPTDEIPPPFVPPPIAQAPDNRPAIIPTSAFASRSQMFDAKLSPRGGKFAHQIRADGRARIAVFDASTRAPIKTIDVGEAGQLRSFQWAGENRLLFSLRVRALIGVNSIPASKLMVYDMTSGETHYVGLRDQGFEGDNLLYVDPAGAFILLSLSQQVFSDPAVYRLRLDGTGEETAELVQERVLGVDAWWADNQGTVRLGLKQAGTRTPTYLYRAAPGAPLIEIEQVRDGETETAIDSWSVQSVRAGKDMGLVLVEDDRGLNVLREFNFATGTAGRIVYANANWGLERTAVEPDGSVSGAIYTDDFERTEWFDPAMARAQNRLERSLGDGAVRILSRAETGRMLVWHGGGNDPGVMYIYTPASNRLDVFGELRPNVDHKRLALPRLITIPARDGTQIPSYLTLPRERDGGGYPLIVYPHGGPYGVRDTMEYDDTVQLLANRGYAVLQPNYRGSDGFGKNFAKLGYGKIGATMQDDIDDATDWAIAQGYADPEKVCIVGGSYGGYVALWGVIRNPERYRCAASWAGVTDFEAQRKHTHRKLPRRSREKWIETMVGDDPDIVYDAVSPVQQIERLTRPILIAHGTRDNVVPFTQFSAMRRAARQAEKPFEELVLQEEGHSLADPANERAWFDALLTFLAKENPSDLNTPEILHEAAIAEAEAEAEAARKAEEEREAEKARLAAEAEAARVEEEERLAAEAARIAEEERAAQEARLAQEAEGKSGGPPGNAENEAIAMPEEMIPN